MLIIRPKVCFTLLLLATCFGFLYLNNMLNNVLNHTCLTQNYFNTLYYFNAYYIILIIIF